MYYINWVSLNQNKFEIFQWTNGNLDGSFLFILYTLKNSDPEIQGWIAANAVLDQISVMIIQSRVDTG